MSVSNNFQEDFVRNLKDADFQKESRNRFQTLEKNKLSSNSLFTTNNDWGSIVHTGTRMHTGLFGSPVIGEPVIDNLPVFGDPVNTFNALNTEDFAKSLESGDTALKFDLPKDDDDANYYKNMPDDYEMSKEESTRYFNFLCDKSEADESILQCDSLSEVEDLLNELPTVRSGKNIKELVGEVMYDLERETDVKKRADLIMRCSRYIRLERMQDNCEY